MNFEQLKYIIDISKTSSLNMTAENMFLTQPAITKSIKTLETELNCVLLKRSKKGVKLTEEGQYFLQYAEKIINLHSEMMQHFNNDEKNLCGNFKIGTASNIAEIFLMDVLFMMQEHYSNFKISSFDLEPEEMFSFLFNNQLDYGFFGFSKQNYSYIKQLSEQYDNKIIITQLFESNTYAVFHKTHHLALKNKLFINDLHQIETTHYGQSSFFNYGNSFCVHVSANSTVHKKYMREKKTVLLTSSFIAKKVFDDKDFVTRQISDLPPICFYMIYKKQKPSCKVENLFISYIIDAANNFKQSIMAL